MIDMKHHYIKNEYRSSLLCIDAYENKALKGRLYNPYLDTCQHFSNVMQLLILAEELFDMMDYPQPFSETRKFWTNPSVQESCLEDETSETGNPPPGKLANFILKVIFRQNASWQGSLAWLDQNKEESFRSVLELLKLLDEAVTNVDEDDESNTDTKSAQ
jgi:hypothetical protein